MQDLTLQLVTTVLCASGWAVREDLLFHRIPNWLNAALLCAGLYLQLSLGGWSGLGQGALGVFTGMAILLPLHLLRATGAGDVKFLGALGAGLGPYDALLAGLCTLMAGAVLAVGYMACAAARAALAPAGLTWPLRLQVGFLRAQEMRRERFPYALAIAVGAFCVLLQRGDVRAVYDYLLGAGQ